MIADPHPTGPLNDPELAAGFRNGTWEPSECQLCTGQMVPNGRGAFVCGRTNRVPHPSLEGDPRYVPDVAHGCDSPTRAP